MGFIRAFITRITRTQLETAKVCIQLPVSNNLVEFPNRTTLQMINKSTNKHHHYSLVSIYYLLYV